MSESKKNGSQDFFRLRREQLRNWPYTIHQIDDTLDIGLIEGRGKQQLFRAIQAQNLSAFAGTGLSIGYGRLGWKDWEYEQQRIVAANAKHFIELNDAAIALLSYLHDLCDPTFKHDGTDDDLWALWTWINGEDPHNSLQHMAGKDEKGIPHWAQPQRHNAWRWFRSRKHAHEFAGRQIRGLNNTFTNTQSSEGGFPGGEELPVKFEVAQQLHSELQRHVGNFLKWADPSQTPAKQQEMRDNPEKFDSTFEKAWFGSRQKPSNGAPERALAVLERFLATYMFEKAAPAELMQRFRTYHTALREFHERVTRKEAGFSFEELAKVLLVDECPHALLLLREGVLRGLDPDDPNLGEPRKTRTQNTFAEWRKTEDKLGIFVRDNLKRNPDGIRQNPERYRVLTPFKLDSFQELIEKAKDEASVADQNYTWKELDEVIKDRLSEYRRKKKGRTYLSPSARFMVSAFLSRLDDPMGYLTPKKDDARENDWEAQEWEPDLSDFVNRSSIIDPMLDPLEKTVNELGIRQYVTTNYDFEIERYFEDVGYREFPQGTDVRSDALADPSRDEFRADDIGGILKDQTFSPENASDMITFAVDRKSQDAAVFHLHGRATEGDSLVITERDYMELYLTAGPNRQTSDEGISLMFSGAPLIFLGLGMNETDLLRPLRQFISNRDRTIGYTSIALLPADSSIAARTKFSSALYLRYGVHTVFYGSGTMQVKRLVPGGTPEDLPQSDQLNGRRGLDWLYRILSLIWALEDVTKAFLPEKEGETVPSKETPEGYESPQKIYAFLEKKVGNVGADLAIDDVGYSEKSAALDILLGMQRHLGKSYEVAIQGPFLMEAERQKKEEALANEEWRSGIVHLLCTERGERSISIQHCAFSPTRPRAHDTPHRDEGDPVSSEDYVGDEVVLLTEMLSMTLSLPDAKTTAKDLAAFERDLRARLLFLKGLAGGFRTGTMNAAIGAIIREQREWWLRFQQSPPHRVAKFQPLERPKTAPRHPHEPRRYIRHRVHGVISNLDSLNHAEDLNGAPIRAPSDPERINQDIKTRIRTFDTFVTAIDSTFDRHQLDPSRRVLMTVAALRGIGKGTFMSAFSTRRGLQLYQQAAWGSHRSVRVSGAIFVNLSFSTEIGSVLDMLVDSVNSEALFVRYGVDDKTNEEDEVYKTVANDLAEIKSAEHLVSRVKRLREAIKRYTAASNDLCPKRWSPWGHRNRLVILINAMELLFDSHRRTKSLEIDEVLSLLMGMETHGAPIDFVFVASETGLGEPWNLKRNRSQKRGLPLRRPLNRENMPSRAKEQVERRTKESGVVFDDPPDQYDPDAATHFIHFARPVSPTTFLIDNFPTLATALFLANPPKYSPEEDGTSTTTEDKFDTLLKKASFSFNANLKKARETSDAISGALWKRGHLPTREELQHTRDIVRNMSARFRPHAEQDAYITDQGNNPPHNTENLFARSEFSADLDQIGEEAVVTHSLIAQLSDLSDIKRHTKPGGERYPQSGTPGDRYWRHPLRERVRSEPHRDQWANIRKRLADSRFSMTILMALAEHIVVHAEDAVAGGQRAAEFITTTVERGRNYGRERRDAFLLETVLSAYRESHKAGDPDLDCDLHQLILRHLGAIGHPLGSAVLVRLPDFRKYFARIGVELEYSRRRFLVRALTTLAYRGLVFRLDPHYRLLEVERDKGRGEDQPPAWPAEQEHRYALHRVVQRFAVANLNMGTEEPIAAISFAPTLYAAMPSSGPRLTAEPYEFLRSLLIGLSQYPDVSNQENDVTPWVFTQEEPQVRVQALRAALCLARSNLSVAIMSRLGEHDFATIGLQKRGVLETYKVRLRWIIRLAWELLDKKYQGRDVKPDAVFDHINALYRDEIVWLYNELGVVALAQGALSDSLGFLRQAAEFNEHVEGRSRAGPNYFSISLNHSIVQLERGRLVSARARLSRIIKATQERKCVLHSTARGYLCVAKHLTGQHEGLAEEFQEVTSALQDLPATRASALLLSHRARFLLDKDLGAARDAIKRATVLAETGGHEDVRHFCNLVDARIVLKHENGSRQLARNRALSMLRDIDAYAERMSIWSLQCESLMHRAGLLLEEGETTTAGRLLTRTIAISRRNAMALRLNRAMTLYALVLLRRGDRRGAGRIAAASLEMAKSSGYNLETSRAQRVLTESEADLSLPLSLAEPNSILF